MSPSSIYRVHSSGNLLSSLNELEKSLFAVLVCALAGIGHAEMPSYYKSVNRVIWLVQNVDLAKQALIPLG